MIPKDAIHIETLEDTSLLFVEKGKAGGRTYYWNGRGEGVRVLNTQEVPVEVLYKILITESRLSMRCDGPGVLKMKHPGRPGLRSHEPYELADLS